MGLKIEAVGTEAVRLKIEAVGIGAAGIKVVGIEAVEIEGMRIGTHHTRFVTDSTHGLQHVTRLVHVAVTEAQLGQRQLHPDGTVRVTGHVVLRQTT